MFDSQGLRLYPRMELVGFAVKRHPTESETGVKNGSETGVKGERVHFYQAATWS
jgi:hypothetical protein